MSDVVIDTNVIATANGLAGHAGERCFTSCVSRLVAVRESDVVLIDDGQLIFTEYQTYSDMFRGQPGAGDQFARWLWQVQADQRWCRKIPITADLTLGFIEFPTDPDLATFDPSDRKFVAVAVGSATNPTVLNATDTGWWHHREPLQRNGIQVDFLCPDLMA